MLSQVFEGYLRTIEAQHVTEVFLWLLTGILAAAIFTERSGRAASFRAYVPTLLTSLGILGTFIGIVVGLLGFNPDPAHLDTSIGDLLKGLKTAFMTSVAGMGASIIFKFLAATPLLRSRRVEASSSAGPDDILAALREQSTLTQAMRDAIAGGEESSLSGQIKLLRTDLNDQTKILAETRRAIAGDEQDSLVGQLKLLRNDLEAQERRQNEALNAFAVELWKRLAEFAEMLSRSATEQVIEALRQVILDFNRNLTEQFGDNFKALDASVQKLVEWQELYRGQIADLHALYQESVKGIVQIEEAVGRVAEASTVIPDTMEKLRAVVETANHQLAELERHLDAFRELRDRAVEAVPQVQAHVQDMTRDIAGAVQTASDHYKELLDVSDKYIEAQNALSQAMLKNLSEAGTTVQRDTQRMQEHMTEAHQQMNEQMARVVSESIQAQSKAFNDALVAQNDAARNILSHLTQASETVQRDAQSVQKQVSESIERMRNQMEKTVTQAAEAQQKATHDAVETLLEQMRQAVSRTSEGVNAQLQAIDQSMQTEINRVMNQMGRALAQIAGKFTEDYTQLTSAMQQIVRQSERNR